MATKDSPNSAKQSSMIAVAIFLAATAYWFTRYKTTSILPTIAGELNGMKLYSWPGMVFALCAAIVAPVWGKVSDIFGRKNILLVLLGLMVLGDLTCALAGNFYLFILGYAISGLGGGGMQGTYFSLLGDLFPPEKRGRYGGVISTIIALTSMGLPILAASITEISSWRNVFLLTSGVYVIAFLAVSKFVPSIKRSGVTRKIDYLGTLFLAGALVPFLLLLSWGGSAYPWGSTRIVTLGVVSVIMFVITYLYESRIPDYGIISTRLLKNYSYLFACLVSVFMAFSMSAVGTYLSLFCQGVQGMTPTLYSTIGVPASVCSIFSGAIAGWLMDRTKRYKWLLVMGPTSAMVTCVIFGLMPPTAPIWFLMAVRVFQQICGASYMPSINPLAAMAQIEPEDYGVGTGTLNLLTSCGNALAPALLGSVMNGVYTKKLAAAVAPVADRLSADQLRMISDARVLVNAGARKALAQTFGRDTTLFNQVVEMVRSALQSSISSVFLTGAAFVFLSVLFATLVKEIPLDQVRYKRRG